MTGPEAAPPPEPPVPPPVIVVDEADARPRDGATSTDRFEALAALLLPSGWKLRSGFDLPARPWDLGDRRWMCCGIVADEEHGERAMAALVRGVGLVVGVEGPSSFRLQVLDDLHHNGALVAARAPDRPVPHVDPDDQLILQALAEGATIDEAARLVMISTRTAHRRLAAVREAYGAANTTEAVARWCEQRSGR